MDMKCKSCGNPDCYYSPLFEEVLCVTCVDMAMSYIMIFSDRSPKTTAEEQYQFYVESFPFNDPRD